MPKKQFDLKQLSERSGINYYTLKARLHAGWSTERATQTMARTLHPNGHAGSTSRPKSPEYQAWTDMKRRCHNRRSRAYRDYGGRGITVCAEWCDDFYAFLRNVGPRPGTGYSIERIDNDGGYEPGNVRWATAKEQQSNRRGNHLVTLEGMRRTLTAWAEVLHVSPSTLRSRIKAGWNIERVLRQPIKAYCR